MVTAAMSPAVVESTSNLAISVSMAMMAKINRITLIKY